MPLKDDENREISFEVQKASIHKSICRRIKWTERQIVKCQEELIACMNWEAIQHEAALLQSNFHLIKKGLAHLCVFDWNSNEQITLALDPKLTPQEEVAKRYKRSKKLKKGLPYLEKRLTDLTDNLNLCTNLLDELGSISDEPTLKLWLVPHDFLQPPKTPSQKKLLDAPKPYYEYTSETGLKIWVGKSAKNNDILTFTHAKGSDFWLHTTHCPGSHVIVRTKKSEEPDPETLKDAIQLALFYSKAKLQGEGEVCITQRKFVSKFGRGRAGKVQISKHKTVFARLNQERISAIKQRGN